MTSSHRDIQSRPISMAVLGAASLPKRFEQLHFLNELQTDNALALPIGHFMPLKVARLHFEAATASFWKRRLPTLYNYFFPHPS
jgi:hypothetical protein